MKSWWPDERDYAGDEHLDPDYVAGYERKAGYDPDRDILAIIELGLSPRSTVIDLGAGTGVFTAAVAPLTGHVTAVDPSPEMAKALRQRAETAPRPNVTVVQGGFLSYEHRGEPADFVFSRNALHQLPDAWKAIALHRITRMLRPGGILRLLDLVFDFGPEDFDARIETWMSGASLDPAVGYTAEDFAKHVRTEFSTYSWILEGMLKQSGFEIIEREYRRDVYATYTCRLAGDGG